MEEGTFARLAVPSLHCRCGQQGKTCEEYLLFEVKELNSLLDRILNKRESFPPSASEF